MWMGILLLLVIDIEKLGVKLVIALILQKKICLKILIKREKIKDFLDLSNETLRESFAATKVTLPRPQNYNVRSYHKSEKCRSQVVYKNLDECKKIEYTVKGQKRSYYKKFWFYI